MTTLLGAWDSGSFTPRLVEPASDEEAAVCKRCAVAQACLQGDTGSRQRLGAWLAAPLGAADATASDAERAAFATLALGAAASPPELA